jgi:transglutaminase-like putative cysteine protease
MTRRFFHAACNRRAFVLPVFVLCCVGSASAADDPPQWLRQAASVVPTNYAKNVPAVVLLVEQNVRVDEDGKVTTNQRRVVKILSKEGRSEAKAAVPYSTDTGKVREMRAWMIRLSGAPKSFGKDEVLDLAAAPNDVFNEVRIKLITARDDAEPGAFFGCEWTTEERSVFTQLDWQFQDRLPAKVSRFTISLPAGWRVEGIMMNHAKIEPTVTGTTYSWELRDLPYIEEEPASPSVTALAPRLAISYFSPPNKKTGIGRTFNNWTDVSRWLTELSDSQAALSDPLATKAKQLIANARTELERIQTIGRYVQNVNYVAIQTGIGRGGGYRPHSAIDVFAKSYGDCKDKANLMRALLKAVGIQSYLVCIYAGDRSFVHEEWPSPQQFNHCIIAVKVSDETGAGAVLNHPVLGRLLIFDPTDGITPVGYLPSSEENSLALVVAGEAGALVRMPSTPPDANLLDRQIDVELGAEGSVSAKVHERSAGKSAVVLRGEFRGLARPDYVKSIEAWITRGASGARVSKVEPSDNAEAGFALDVDFKAEHYGQLMQGRLLIFRPAIVSRRESVFLTEATRKYPVVLEGHAYVDTVKIKLPAGFEVDELPEPVKLETPFGSYTTTYVAKDGNLQFTRKLTVQAATIPVADYSKVRSFYEQIRKAEQTPVVLARK